MCAVLSKFAVPGSEGEGMIMFVMDVENKLLRFDLFYVKDDSQTQFIVLSYLAHAYGAEECFSRASCYTPGF